MLFVLLTNHLFFALYFLSVFCSYIKYNFFRYLSCPELDDIESDTTDEESLNINYKKTSKPSTKKKLEKQVETAAQYEKLGERFDLENEVSSNTNNHKKKDYSDENKEVEISLAFARKKSRVIPEEIKINTRDIKGYAMEFESIYDHYQRDLDSLESLDLKIGKSEDIFNNVQNLGPQENKMLKQRRSLINPFVPITNNQKIVQYSKRLSVNCLKPQLYDNDYQNLKNIDELSFPKNHDNFVLKERTNSILNILQINIKNKLSFDQYDQ